MNVNMPMDTRSFVRIFYAGMRFRFLLVIPTGLKQLRENRGFLYGKMYCSLDEAFQTSAIPDTVAQSSSSQPKQKKKKQRNLPPEPFFVDPDRPANRPLPPAEYVGGGGGADIAPPNMEEQFFPHPNDDIKEAADAYKLEPDWAAQFKHTDVPSWIKDRMAAKSAEVPLFPATKPWMDGQPTLWKPTPQPLRTDAAVDARLAEFEARIDERLTRMFARLEDIDRSRSESNHMEIILFILGGFFLLLMLDMLVKQGMRATMMIAAAGGGSAAMRAFVG